MRKLFLSQVPEICFHDEPTVPLIYVTETHTETICMFFHKPLQIQQVEKSRAHFLSLPTSSELIRQMTPLSFSRP